jgi:pantoate--beta-alanine ligase
VITTERIAEVRKHAGSVRADGRRVGFVPTMGALHEVHASLIRRARAADDFVIVSIFVNPTQFGPSEDLDAYPRTLASDLETCELEGVDLVFHPTGEEMYPHQVRTSVEVAGLFERMEGVFRPGHLDGVALVCLKLFNIVGGCRAYFGEKDAQQLRVVRAVVDDLDLDLEIVGCPTVREPDGLALSSRNAYLGREERERARCLFCALEVLRRLVAEGEREVRTLVAAGREVLDAEADEVDYLEIVEVDSLEPLSRLEGRALACGAIRIGATRLIDNTTLEIDEMTLEGER